MSCDLSSKNICLPSSLYLTPTSNSNLSGGQSIATSIACTASLQSTVQRTKCPAQYINIFVEVEALYNKQVPAQLLMAQAYTESGFAESVITGNRVSSAGALGMMQFMKGTAKSFGLTFQTDSSGKVIPNSGTVFDPKAAVTAAAKYDLWLYNFCTKYGHGCWVNALCGYNAGQGSIKNKNFVFSNYPLESQNYAKKILSLAGMAWDYK